MRSPVALRASHLRASYLRAVGAGLIAAVGAWGAWTAREWRPEDGYYTTACFGLVTVLAIASAARDLREGLRAAAAARAADAGAGGKTIPRDRVLKLVAVTVLTLGYAQVWDTAGYLVPTVVYVLAMLLVLGVRRWVPLIVTPPALTGFVLVVFGELLNIPLP